MDLTHFDNICHTINKTLIHFVGVAEKHKRGIVEEFYFQRQRGILEAIMEHNDGVVEAVRKAASEQPENRYVWQCTCGMDNDITLQICSGCGSAAPVLSASKGKPQ